MRKLKVPVALLLAVALLAYAWWLGRAVWLPAANVVVTHNGKRIDVKVYESPDGLFSFSDPDGDLCFTVDFAFAGGPIRLYRGSAFRDYLLFAIPKASARGLPIPSSKDEHDSKIRWAGPNRVEFIDYRGHIIWVDF